MLMRASSEQELHLITTVELTNAVPFTLSLWNDQPSDNCSGGQQSQSCGCSSSVSSFSVSLRRPEQLQQLQQYLPAPLLLPNSFNVGLYSAITGCFAPSSVRPLDVSPQRRFAPWAYSTFPAYSVKTQLP